jgi:ESS family glutamate:Na+ symporter
MKTIELNLLWTLALATALFFIGQFIVWRSQFLQRYSIPVPVVGGVLFALLLAVASLATDIQFEMDDSPRDPLLLAFFATLGLGADLRSLLRGGWKLVILIGLFVAVMIMQGMIGMAMASALDLHPLVGLLGGSISLIGGHGTAAAYATSFAEHYNLQGALELGMAAATAGLILGSLLAGPVAERVMRRIEARGERAGQPLATQALQPRAVLAPITAEQLLFVLLVCLACIAGAHYLQALLRDSGLLLPSFLWALLIGMLVRNVGNLLGLKGINDSAVQAVGSVSLSLFLIMALMSMKILGLVAIAGPLLLIVLVNAAATAAFAYFITSRLMGGDYDAAVISGGQVAAGLATTAVGMSVMQTLTERHGPSPVAFLLIPIVGAFFADIANALVLQAFFALPMMGF